MKRKRFGLIGALLLLLWLPAGALALTGQSISTFEVYYKENLTFINDNTGRHLLPAELSTTPFDDSGRTRYYTDSDELHVSVTADAQGIIETCEIRLLYPQGAVQGNGLYQDFSTATYHSLAYIMSMHVSSEASSRYLLGEEIRDALAANSGSYERILGSYTISCVSVIGEGAVFTFLNNGLAPAATETPAGTEAPAGGEETPAVTDDDDGANVG